MRMTALPLLVALATPLAGAAQSQAAAEVDALMAPYEDGPGGVVAVVKDGELVFAEGYGLANVEHRVPMTAETILDIGSIAKQFTAFAVILLERDGALSFDDDIRRHLPSIPDFGTPITVRHLIHHTSGLREIYNAKMLEGWQSGDGISQEDAQRLTARMRELNFEPGSEYLYCNTGYMLLADVVAAASGKAFPDFMRERVFGPLGMDDTVIMDELGMSIPGSAESYEEAGDGLRRVFDNSALFGAGGIYTTAGDLAKWMTNLGSGAVGGPEAVAQLRERGILSNGDTLSYAFGITVGEVSGTPLLTHGGSSAGFRALLAYFPELDGGVITMSNYAQFDGTINRRVAGLFFPDEIGPVVEEAEEPEVPPTPADAHVVSEELLERYVGDYELEIRPGAIVSITREGGRLFGRPTGQSRVELTATSDSTFAVQDIASLTFHRDPDGAVNRITLHQNGNQVGHRIDRWEPSTEELTAYAGRYFSPELETLYTVVIEDGALVARHRRHDPFTLEPTEPDQFSARVPLAEVRFERNEEGAVTGLRVSNGRVRNMWFERIGG